VSVSSTGDLPELTRDDIAWVMRTVDRSPQTNYLGATLRRLEASAGEDEEACSILGDLIIVDSRPDDPTRSTPWWGPHVSGLFHPRIVPAATRLTNNQNAIRALEVGLATGKPWICHLEDDIDVIDRFFDGVAQWLTDHTVDWRNPEYLLYTFHAPYKGVRVAVAEGHTSWRYAVSGFYGNQCWAMGRDAAERLLTRLYAQVPTWSSGQGFDLLIKEWATIEGDTHFLASAPSFVQHVGTESSLHLGRFHQNGSFPGQTWRYDEHRR
jgi:hypothetical protein